MKWITALFKKDKKKVIDANVEEYKVDDINLNVKISYGTSPMPKGYKSVDKDEVYEAAFYSDDIDRKIRATEIKTDNILNRHFLLQSIISESYRLRKEEYYLNLCIKFSEINLSEFDEIANAFRNEDNEIPRILVFQYYSTVLTEINKYEKAINVCERAISFGLEDGTKGGFYGRIDKIKKKMNKII